MKKIIVPFCGLFIMILMVSCKKASIADIKPVIPSDTLKIDTTKTSNKPIDLFVQDLINNNSNQNETSVITATAPWEAGGLVWCSVHQADSVVSLYYLADDANKVRHVCYAYSTDGIHFIKPNLKQVSYRGDLNNNIIKIDFDSMSFFYDPNTPATPYKLCGMASDHKLYVAYSADGINFSRGNTPIVDYFCDTQNEIIYDAETSKFKYYLRNYVYDTQIANPYHGIFYYRGVAYFEADSLQEITIGPNPKHHPYSPTLFSVYTELPTIIDYNRSLGQADVYTPGVVKYDKNIYIAYSSIFNYYPPPPVGKFNNDGYQSISIYSSEDGKNFKLNKPKFINNEPYSYYLGPGFASKKDMLINYYWKVSTTHGNPKRASEIIARTYKIASQRLESINAYNHLPTDTTTTTIR